MQILGYVLYSSISFYLDTSDCSVGNLRLSFSQAIMNLTESWAELPSYVIDQTFPREGKSDVQDHKITLWQNCAWGQGKDGGARAHLAIANDPSQGLPWEQPGTLRFLGCWGEILSRQTWVPTPYSPTSSPYNGWASAPLSVKWDLHFQERCGSETSRPVRKSFVKSKWLSEEVGWDSHSGAA